jgi:hypothetical protein
MGWFDKEDEVVSVPTVRRDIASTPVVRRPVRLGPSDGIWLGPEVTLPPMEGMDFTPEKPKPAAPKISNSELSSRAAEMLKRIEAEHAAVRPQPNTKTAEGKQQYFDPEYAQEMAKRGIDLPVAKPLERRVPAMEMTDSERLDRQRRLQAYMRATGASISDVMDREMRGEKLDMPSIEHMDRQNQIQVHGARTGESLDSIMDKELRGEDPGLPSMHEVNKLRNKQEIERQGLYGCECKDGKK